MPPKPILTFYLLFLTAEISSPIQIKFMAIKLSKSDKNKCVYVCVCVGGVPTKTVGDGGKRGSFSGSGGHFI